ncbi:hypothetical protein PR048_020472 [Dryococelus australis]|uniref:DDE-1 domain-containing protein n=1 Tax=Dryococelus australis TaxID=614101 RepID=A0ABQ9H6D2_9NEOP|nr:hypothetical protein PR048_020472 [Dryococelus australis]
MVGDLEIPLAVGKAANPRLIKGLDRDSLPVQWKSNEKSWVTADTIEEWLQGFNLKIKNQNIARAAKEVRPDTVRKCFAKADFKEIEETDNNEDNQPINELADMLRRGCQDIDAEAVVSFDNNLCTEGVDRAVQLIHNHPGDEAGQEDDGENNDEEDESIKLWVT